MLRLLKRATVHEADWRDRRRSERVPLRLPAEIILAGGRAHPCRTEDMSAGGARLRLPPSVMLPGEFELAIPVKRFRRRVRLAWRGDGIVGVTFL